MSLTGVYSKIDAPSIRAPFAKPWQTATGKTLTSSSINAAPSRLDVIECSLFLTSSASNH